MGLTILPPDINASDWAYRGFGRAIRVGLMQLKALREDFVKQIVAEREARGPYRSLQHFLDRLTPETAQTTLLIKAGCFDSVAGELTRPALIWRLYASQSRTPAGYLPIPADYSSHRQLAHEWELFGFPLSGHPLDRITKSVAGRPHIHAKDLPRHVGTTVRLLGWMVTEKIVSTKQGEPMEFVTFEDRTGLYDATFFPDTYRRYCHLLASAQAYLITGKVEAHFAAVTLTVNTLQPLTITDWNAADDQ